MSEPAPATAFLAALFGICRHPGQLHPGEPVLLEPHRVWGEQVGDRLPVTVDGTRAPLAGDLIILDWHDSRGRTGATVYDRNDYIRLRKTA